MKTKLCYSRNDLVFFLGIGKYTTIITVIYHFPTIQSKMSSFVVHIATRTYREFGCLVEIFIDEHTCHGHWECGLGHRHALLPARLLGGEARYHLAEKT